MLVVKPAPASATPSAPSSSANTPVHIDIDSDDDSSSSTTDDDEELIEQHVPAAPQVIQTGEAARSHEHTLRKNALEVETNGASVPARAASSASPSPVSRLNGYAAGANITPSESTGSSPPSDRRRSGVNTAFLKSVREDLMQRTSPTKASLKRPLVLQSDRQTSMQGRAQNRTSTNSGDTVAAGAGNTNTVPSAQKVIIESPERKRGPNGYQSSSDSSDVDEENDKEDDDDDDDELIVPPPVKKPKPDAAQLSLNFFMRASQVPFVTDPERASAAQTAAVAAAAQQSQQHTRICSSRTRICGQVFGCCELVFSDRSVELVLSRQGESDKRIWQGTLKYAHLRRFWYVVM